ncbi:MAG: SpaH/EbpB family LPXTG-anchored major pilin [Oscillibacter sp.]|nr:SpaH/EbpB family LPXTG-anchored major pilin [Oscillibacter sp.]
MTIKEKNAAPTNVKEAEEDSTSKYGTANDADIGQTVNFKSTITAQAGAENYVFHDKMSAGLQYTGVTGITLNGVAVGVANYEVKTTGITDGCTFEVVFTQAFCDTLKANDKIVISYTAVVTKDAVIGGDGNLNQSQIEYGENGKTTTTPPSETKTYTWKLDVLKYTMKDDQEVKLAGAKFTLSKNPDGSAPIRLVEVEKNVYRVATEGEKNTVTEITTDETGSFTIQGLDSDTYYLTETSAPAGYNVLKSAIEVKVSDKGEVTYIYDGVTATGTVKVENKTGAELPSTGGIGTTIFYVVGGLLVVAAGVLLVTRKRMSKSED